MLYSTTDQLIFDMNNWLFCQKEFVTSVIDEFHRSHVLAVYILQEKISTCLNDTQMFKSARQTH